MSTTIPKLMKVLPSPAEPRVVEAKGRYGAPIWMGDGETIKFAFSGNKYEAIEIVI
jgi:hypothetical protein